MSIKQIDRVMHLPADLLSAAQFRILSHLANYATDSGSKIFAGPARLQQVTNLNERTVRLTLRLFERRGWLQRERAGGGRGRQPVYTLTVPLFDRRQSALPFPKDESYPSVSRAAPLCKGGSEIPLLKGPKRRKGDLRSGKGDLDDSFSPASASDCNDLSPRNPSIDPSSTTRKNTGADAPAHSPPVEKSSEVTRAEGPDPLEAALPDRSGAIRGEPLRDVRGLAHRHSDARREPGFSVAHERSGVEGDGGRRGFAAQVATLGRTAAAVAAAAALSVGVSDASGVPAARGSQDGVTGTPATNGRGFQFPQRPCREAPAPDTVASLQTLKARLFGGA